MALLNFPNELFYIIAEDLSTAELNFFCQTCRRLNILFAPLLHNILLEQKDEVLIWAARAGNELVVRTVVENGADVNYWCGTSPLYAAVGWGHAKIVKFLLAKGGDMDVHKGPYERTALHEAASGNPGSDMIARILIDNGANVDGLGGNGMTPLHHAALDGAEAVAKVLLEKGCNVNFRRTIKDRSTPLIYAARSGNEEMVKMLLDAGADISIRNSRQITALHSAAESGFRGQAVARLLIEKGADITARDYRRKTPLLCAAGGGSTSTVKLMLEKGSSIDARDEDHQTALHAAAKCCYSGEVSMIGILVEGGVDINARDRMEETPLHAAAADGVDEMIKELLKYGAEIEAQGSDGQTALHYAATSSKIYRPHLPAVEALLDNGADINAQDKSGQTALHGAIKKIPLMVRDNELELVEPVIKLLLERGADTELKDSEGYTVSRLVMDSGRYEKGLVDLVLKYSAKPVVAGDHSSLQMDTLDSR